MRGIPTVDDVASAPMRARYGEPFNPPGLTNFLGCVQVDVDLTAIRSFNVPPLACSDTVTAALFLDHRYFPSTGAPVTIRWLPDRIEREAVHDGLRLRSTTFMALGRPVTSVILEVENLGEGERTVDLALGFRSTVTKYTATWNAPFPPAEFDNKVSVDRGRRALAARAMGSRAYCLQGTSPQPDELTAQAARFSVRLGPRERWTLTYVNALGESIEEAQEHYDAVLPRAAEELERVTADWNAELAAAFTPGNDRYSGSLPVFETADEDLRRLYLIGALGVIYFKRDNPASVIGRAYDTLMPKFWQTVTFLWDYSLSSNVHAMLDPDVMRKYLEYWMSTDVHTHFGTAWLTGAPVGCWYSVNDFAMVKTMRDYVRWTGHRDWFRSDVGAHDGEAKPVLEYMREYATNWERFRTLSGLADYGSIGNLLECVSTYTHEVASLNAANVWSLRATAEVLELLGEQEAGALMELRAADVVKEVLRLYAEGEGWWYARKPDGSLLPVRHCYDLITVLNTIPGDLTDTQVDEMAEYFVRELWAPNWMQALSSGDPDAMFSVRPDHQWTGAYTAWPALGVQGLFAAGKQELAARWLRGLAASANQGPFGQAHFAEPVFPSVEGGARKAPADMPYITDWACSSGGAWVNVFVESLFGVDATIDRGVTATPALEGTDPDARLVHLPYQGRLYTVDRTGIREE